MSDALKKAEAAAKEASQDTDVLRIVAAVLATQQATQQTAAPAAPAPAARQHNTGKWIAIGLAGSVCAISLALSAIAIAIGAVAVTCCLLVLRSMWRDVTKR